MSLEIVSSFFTRLESDDGLKRQVDSADSVDDVVGIAAEAGFAFSASELFEAALKTSGFDSNELSEEQLEAVAGGVQAAKGDTKVSGGCPTVIAWLTKKKTCGLSPGCGSAEPSSGGGSKFSL